MVLGRYLLFGSLGLFGNHRYSIVGYFGHSGLTSAWTPKAYKMKAFWAGFNSFGQLFYKDVPIMKPHVEIIGDLQKMVLVVAGLLGSLGLWARK